MYQKQPTWYFFNITIPFLSLSLLTLLLLEPLQNLTVPHIKGPGVTVQNLLTNHSDFFYLSLHRWCKTELERSLRLNAWSLRWVHLKSRSSKRILYETRTPNWFSLVKCCIPNENHAKLFKRTFLTMRGFLENSFVVN